MRFEAMQLKVCEGCGCLWLRSRAERKVYCAACTVKLAPFPRVSAERRPGRKARLKPAMQGGGL